MSDDDDEPKGIMVPKGFDFTGLIEHFSYQELLELAHNAMKSDQLNPDEATLLDDFVAYVQKIEIDSTKQGASQME